MCPAKAESPKFRLNLAAVKYWENPGPGTYRIDSARSPGRQAPGPPNSGRAVFGSPRATPRHLAAAVVIASQTCSSTRSLSARAQVPAAEAVPTAISIGACSHRGERRKYPWTLVSPAVTIAGSSAGTVSASRSGGNSSAGSSGSGSSSSSGSSSRGCDEISSADQGKDAGNRSNQHSHRAGSSSAHVSTHNSSSLGGKKWSFGPPGGLAKGQQRRRSLEANVYISAQHTAIDPGTAAARKIPGPMYAVVGKLQLLSTHRAHGTAVFSSGAREAGSKMYLSAELAKADPTLSLSPGPGTATIDLMGSITATANKHSKCTTPRFGPPPSGAAKQPYISKQHETLRAGQDSPGPACYDAVTAALGSTALGDRRTVHFGSGEREAAQTVLRPKGPGPGAYVPNEGKLSTHANSPAYSLGAACHSMLAGNTVTSGVGAYAIDIADRLCFPNNGAATIKGKLNHGNGAVDSCSPGPAAYRPLGPAEGMGYEAELDWIKRWSNLTSIFGEADGIQQRPFQNVDYVTKEQQHKLCPLQLHEAPDHSDSCKSSPRGGSKAPPHQHSRSSL